MRAHFPTCTPMRYAKSAVGATALAVLAAGMIGAPARGAPIPVDPTTVGEDVAAALDAAPSSRADAGTGPDGCLTGVANPDPVVYRTDRIVLRSGGTDAAIRDAVDDALTAVGGPGTAGGIERILPPVPAAARVAAAGTGGALAADEVVDAEDTRPVVVVTIDTGADGTPRIVPLARELRKRQPPIDASPDYLLSPSPNEGVWPFGFPVPTTLVEPVRTGLGGGAVIHVFDTGIPNGSGSRAPNLTRLTATDVELLDVVRPAGNVVDWYYGGHTYAIGGVTETVAPSSTVKAIKISEPNGAITDVSAARRMAQTLNGAKWPDVMVLAFGSPACNGGTTNPGLDLAPIGLEAMAQAVAREGESLVVASAGNRSSSRKFYPAAFDTATQRLDDAVIAVGAMTATDTAGGTRWSSTSRTAPVAGFSNRGSWLEAWAPGVKLDTRHVANLRFSLTGPVLNGRATVDGTSFSAPYVGALVAEQIGRSPAADRLTGREAWRAVAQTGRACVGAGRPGVALALTTMAATATTPGVAGTAVQC